MVLVGHMDGWVSQYRSRPLFRREVAEQASVFAIPYSLSARPPIASLEQERSRRWSRSRRTSTSRIWGRRRSRSRSRSRRRSRIYLA